MGDTVSIPDQNGQSATEPRKPSPPPDHVPEKGALLEPPHPPTLINIPIKHESKRSKRCPQCRKEGKKRKLTITNRFACKHCQTDLCADHISSHDCEFDHHEHHKTLLTKNNPVIQFKKLDKI